MTHTISKKLSWTYSRSLIDSGALFIALEILAFQDTQETNLFRHDGEGIEIRVRREIMVPDIMHAGRCANLRESLVQSRSVLEEVRELVLVVEKASEASLKVADIHLVHAHHCVVEADVTDSQLIAEEIILSSKKCFHFAHATKKHLTRFSVGLWIPREATTVDTVVDRVNPLVHFLDLNLQIRWEDIRNRFFPGA